MISYAILKLIHILLFVFWLGTDLAVFYTSKYVIDPSLSAESRLTAAKIMDWCDMLPRICMTLFLPSGFFLAYHLGMPLTVWHLVFVVLISVFWLSMVLTIHKKKGASYHSLLKKIDTYFRWLMIIALVGWSFYSYSSDSFENGPWILLKVLGFAFTIFCGLMIRLNLKEFNTSFGNVMAGTASDHDNILMAQNLGVVKIWVILIWVTLIAAAYIGIAKPYF